MCLNYCKGINFVYKYYYYGCPTWSWYYPYYNTPLITSLFEYISIHSNELSVTSDHKMGKPFSPIQQLVAVIPPQSAITCLPNSINLIMLDTNSVLSHFFVELSSRKKRDQIEVRLPFIDEELLVNVIHPYELKLDIIYQKLNEIHPFPSYYCHHDLINNNDTSLFKSNVIIKGSDPSIVQFKEVNHFYIHCTPKSANEAIFNLQELVIPSSILASKEDIKSTLNSNVKKLLTDLFK